MFSAFSSVLEKMPKLGIRSGTTTVFAETVGNLAEQYLSYLLIAFPLQIVEAISVPVIIIVTRCQKVATEFLNSGDAEARYR